MRATGRLAIGAALRPLAVLCIAWAAAASPAQSTPWPGGKGLLEAAAQGLPLIAGELACRGQPAGTATVALRETEGLSAGHPPPSHIRLPAGLCLALSGTGGGERRLVAALDTAGSTPASGPGRPTAIAARGHAVAPAEPAAWIAALRRFAEAGRRGGGDAPAAALVALLRYAPVFVARDALRLLAGLPDLDTRLAGGELATDLLGAVVASERPLPLRRLILRRLGQRRVTAMRPYLAAVARPGTVLEGPALDAIGAIDGAFEEHWFLSLLTRRQPAVRAAAVRHAPSSALRPLVAPLVTRDPAPQVRVAAVRRLLAEKEGWATAAALFGRAEPDPAARREIACLLEHAPLPAQER